jgi:carbon monoxide dehydrogenase subunit G
VIFEDALVVEAPVPRVWDLLLDVNRSAACVPGVEHVVLVDERTFDGTIDAQVGPISGRFSFRARIVESEPPRRLVARVEGTDSVTKSTLIANMAMTLEPTGVDSTTLAYRAVVDVRGRLAILGDMVLRATAVLIIREFTKRLSTELAASRATG